jgi:multiple sugar transport system permease protein
VTQAERIAPSLQPAVVRPARRLADLSESGHWAIYLLLPSLLLVMAVAVYPVASGVWLSFQRYNLLRTPVPVFFGLGQYADLWGDAVFWASVRNTVVWVVFGASSQFLLGLVTALALNRPGLRGLGILRIGLLLPWLMPTVVAGHMWSLLLDSRLGVVNDLLVRTGLLHGYVAWFAQAETAMPAVLVVDLWKNFPFFTLLLLAGLQGVPDELYEAAALDGAGMLARFWHVTVPMITPTIVFNLVLGMINAFQYVTQAFVVSTSPNSFGGAGEVGGPAGSTLFFALHIYDEAFQQGNIGYASALAWVLVAAVVLLTLLLIRISGPWVHYGS